MSVSFNLIKIGEGYSRKFLAEVWGYAGFEALAKGVFTPKEDPKIILFVTAEKDKWQTQYKDKLVGEYLHWEGPNNHSAEDRMINSRSWSQEIHLFYRKIRKDNFIYFGRVQVIDVEIETKKPSKFVFHLTDYYSDVDQKIISESWSRNQTLAVFNLYLKLSSGKLEPDNHEVRELALMIGKYENSVAMRLNNFAYTDPYNKQNNIVGLSTGADDVKFIWNEFFNNQEDIVFESEQAVANFRQKTVEENYPEILFDTYNLKGEEKERLIKTRTNQGVFRKMILRTYKNQCAISGINLPELLVAGHIVPWAENEQDRLNPENGLCLSNLYDRAYEKGLICIDTDYKVLISKRLKEEVSKDFFQRFFGHFEYQSIQIPKTYQPKKEFLEYRLNRFDK